MLPDRTENESVKIKKKKKNSTRLSIFIFFLFSCILFFFLNGQWKVAVIIIYIKHLVYKRQQHQKK